MKRSILIAIPLSATLFAPSAPISAQTTTTTTPFTVVETGKSFARLQLAVNSLAGRDGTIRIAPGRYRDCAIQTAGRITYTAAVAGQAIFDTQVCEGKATLVLRGISARVQGLVFTRLFVPDGNGAGIRIEKGDLAVYNSMFIDSQCGIISANPGTGNIIIDRSTFSGLGKDPTGYGAHALYVGKYGSLTLTNSRFERGTGGHYVKTRAKTVRIMYNSIDDTYGSHTNYLIDLSNGATGLISGNVLVNGPNKDNYSTMITVAPEGALNSSIGLVVEKNRAWLATGFKWTTTLVGNWSGQPVTVRDNQLAAKITAYAVR